MSVRGRRSSFASGVGIEMVEDLAHDAGLGDESDDAEKASTSPQKRVELEKLFVSNPSIGGGAEPQLANVIRAH